MQMRGRIAFGFAAGAVVYSVALITFVVAVPAMNGETLLSYGGPLTLITSAQCLLVSLLVFGLLRRQCRTGDRTATTVAWTVGSIYFAWSILGAVTLAWGAFPGTLLLLLAIALTPRPAPRVLA